MIQAYTYSYQEHTLHICSLHLLRLTYSYLLSIIAYTSPSFWLYSHITSNFVFALSLISIVDYRFVQTMSEAESAIFYRNTMCCCP